MPKKAAPLSINLLPGKELSFGEKFLNFSLTFGRYIIIGTEIIVLVAFFSRFKLDRDLIDLNDKIKEKQKILSTQKPIEDRVNRLQIRFSEIKKAESAQANGILALPNIGPVTPEEITYKTITIDQDKVTIAGFAKETSDISRFVSALKSIPIFEGESVTIESIERTEPENPLTFTITAIAKKGNR